MLKKIFILGLISSIGSWILWLSLGPFYSSLIHETQSTESLAKINFIRQILIVLGSIQAAYRSDHTHNIHELFYKNELAQVILGIGLYIILVLGIEHMETLILIWTGLRFFVAGQSFIYGFKVVESYVKSIGNSGTIHFLMTQGAVIFASIIAFVFYKNYLSLKIGLFLDITSSFGLLYIIRKIIKTKKRPLTGKNLKGVTLYQKFYDSLILLFDNRFFPQNIIYLLLLFSTCGFVVTSWHFSINFTLFGRSVYPLCSFYFGICFWINSVLITRKRVNTYHLLYLGLLSNIVSSLLFLKENQVTFLNILLYIFALTSCLVCSTKILLDKSTINVSGRLRASMLFYFSLIFGVGEYFISQFFLFKKMNFVAGIRISLIMSTFLILRTLSKKMKFIVGILYFLSVFTLPNLQAAKIVYKRPLYQSFNGIEVSVPPTESGAFILKQIYDNLFTYTLEGGLEGNILSRWTIDRSWKNFQFFIKHDIYFHDGSKLKAEDVKESILKMLKRSTHIITPSTRLIKTITSDEKKMTVSIILNETNSSFLNLLADNTAIVLKRDQSIDQVNGTGPFKVLINKKDNVILVKNNLYHRNPPKIDQLVLTYEKKDKAIKKYIHHEYDDLFHFYLSKNERHQLKDRCNWYFEKLPTFRSLILKESNHPILKSKKFRGCLLSLINREKLIKSWGEEARPLDYLLPVDIFGGNSINRYRKRKKCSAMDMSKIKKLSVNHPIRFALIKTSPKLALNSLAFLKEESISTETVEARNIKEYVDLFKTKKVDIYTVRFTPTNPDIESYVNAFFGEHPLFPTKNDTEGMIKKTKVLGPWLNINEKNYYIAQLFREISELNVFMPLHQFIFSGCIQKKWKNVEIPLNGFVGQELLKVDVK